MDRLDLWLNSQAGWRRAVLLWLPGCPLAIMAGTGIWAFTTPGIPGPGLAFLTVAAASAVVVALIAWGTQTLMRRRRVTSPGRPISWRMYGAPLCWATAVIPSVLTDQQPYWPHIHRLVGTAQLLCLLAAAAFWVTQARWQRRMARATGPGVPPKSF